MTKPLDEMTAEEFDEYFDNGGDVSELFKKGPVFFPNKTKQISLKMPNWLIDRMDRYAKHYGVSRNAYINMRLAQIEEDDFGGPDARGESA